MKNFRKVLALVLVVATLFSFTAMTSAAKYEDADKISYEMAVDVLSAVGILNGYEVAKDEFEFHPTDKITREEMAKMIAVLANSGTDVSELYATACTFADVAKDRWSASYVAYCAKTGIVAGRSASTFDPKANVTGLETAKMLLVLLGFDAQAQGYVGADWKVNVLRDAKVMGLLSGFTASYDIEANITREEAAQMMLNALEAPCVVGLVSDKIVKVTNALVFTKDTIIVNGTTATGDAGTYPIAKVASNATLKDALSAGNWALYENVLISDDVLAATLFKGLEFNTNPGDCFHRATTSFTYKVKGVVKASGTYSVAAGTVYTTQVDLAAECKAYKDKYAVDIYADGQLHKQYTKAQWTAAAAEVAKESGNGTETVITTSWNDKTETGTVVVNIIHTFIGKVAGYDKYGKTFDIVDENGTTIEVENVAVSEAVANGDFVLYHLCDRAEHYKKYATYGSLAVHNGRNVHSYTVVEPVLAKVDYSRDYDAAGHINKCFMKSTDGDTYYYNNYVGRNYAVDYGAVKGYTELTQGETKALYLDKYGYIMLTATPAETKYVAYVEEGSESKIVNGTYWDNGWQEKTAAGLEAAVYSGSDGAVELSDLKVKEDSDLFGYYNMLGSNQYATGALVQYTVDAYGYAERTAIAPAYVDYGTVIKSSTTNVPTLYTAQGTNFGLDADTVFMIRETNPATGAWTYKEIVGVGNLDAAYAVTRATYVDLNGNVQVNTTNVGTTAQLLDTDKDNYADYVFIDGKYTSGAAEFIIMAEQVEYKASWTGSAAVAPKYDAYRALVNGEDAIVLYAPVTTGEAMNAGLARGILYTGVLAMNGVAMVEDNEMPLYVATSAAKVAELAYAAKNGTIDIDVDSAENVYVSWTCEANNDLGTTDGEWMNKKGVEEVPVYHLTKYGLANAYTGYWVETNEISADDTLGTVIRSYVVTNSSGVVTAVYLIHSGYVMNGDVDVNAGGR